MTMTDEIVAEKKKVNMTKETIIKALVANKEVTAEDIAEANLSETDIIDILKGMQKDIVAKVSQGAKSTYLANGWFSPVQISQLFKQYRALLLNPTISHVHVPLLHQYNNTPYVADEGSDMGYEWATMTYKSDVLAIYNSDLVLAAFSAGDEDSGTAVEFGIAIGAHKPAIAYYEGDINKDPINLMIAFGADSYVRSEEELANFDFMDIAPRKHDGKII